MYMMIGMYSKINYLEVYILNNLYVFEKLKNILGVPIKNQV